MTIDAPLRSQIPQLRTLWREAFGDSEEFIDGFCETALSADRCRCVTEGGQVVAAVYWFDCSCQGQAVAYLYALATAKSHRGRGIARALMDHTRAHLEKLGYRGILLVPGEAYLTRVYQGMGYRPCTTVREFCCTGAAEEIQIYRIDKEAYGKLRRTMLPAGGVIQEEENLDFLEKQARFYTGPGFLLAARGQEDSLFGVEYLGDPNLAPAILRALGFSQGTFRTPGEGEPFAMYLPLSQSAPNPTYFGLAFD